MSDHRILRRSGGIAASILAAWTAVVAQAPPAAPGAPVPAQSLMPPEGALVPVGGAPDLDILVTGDVIGYLDPCG